MPNRTTRPEPTTIVPEPRRTPEPPPAFELRCGGLRLTLQRLPGPWVLRFLTAAGGVAAGWLFHR